MKLLVRVLVYGVFLTPLSMVVTLVILGNANLDFYDVDMDVRIHGISRVTIAGFDPANLSTNDISGDRGRTGLPYTLWWVPHTTLAPLCWELK